MLSRIKKGVFFGFLSGAGVGGCAGTIIYLKIFARDIYKQLVCQYSLAHQCRVPGFDYSSCYLDAYTHCPVNDIDSLKSRADSYAYDQFITDLPIILGIGALGGSIIGCFISYLCCRRQRQNNFVTFYQEAEVNSPTPYRVNELQARFDQTEWQGEIPENFQDPITYELMNMPTLINSGHIYNASTLQRIMEDPKKCPLTRVIITDQMLDNYLKIQIENFVIEKELWRKQLSQQLLANDNKNENKVEPIEEMKHPNQTVELIQIYNPLSPRQFESKQIELNQLRGQLQQLPNSPRRNSLFARPGSVSSPRTNPGQDHVIEILDDKPQLSAGNVR